MEVLQHPSDGAESAALTDSNPSREEEERHNRLISENNNLKEQIAEVSYGHVSQASNDRLVIYMDQWAKLCMLG